MSNGSIDVPFGMTDNRPRLIALDNSSEEQVIVSIICQIQASLAQENGKY